METNPWPTTQQLSLSLSLSMVLRYVEGGGGRGGQRTFWMVLKYVEGKRGGDKDSLELGFLSGF